MTELLNLIQNYGATSLLSVVCILLFYSLNKERGELLNRLDDRTSEFIKTIQELSSSIKEIKEDIEELKK